MTNLEIARKNREAVIDLLERFVDVSRTQVARLLFGGNVRAANRVLTSLYRAKRVNRFSMTLRGESIYRLPSKGKGPTGQTPHSLDIAELYTQMVTAHPYIHFEGWGNRKLADDLITDLLLLSESRTYVVEVHRASNSFGTKIDRYIKWKESKPAFLEQRPVTIWIVAPAHSVHWLEKKAADWRQNGVTIVVSNREDALVAPWRCLSVQAQTNAV